MSRFDNIFEYDANLNGAGLKIGIVMSRFNLPVCEGLLSACVAELKRLGVADADMTIANVPGALEIPLVLQSLAHPTIPAGPSWKSSSIPAFPSPTAS